MGRLSTEVSRLVEVDLPSTPVVIEKLHALMADGDVGSRLVAKIVETDPPFVAKLLKLVNSPFYGCRRKISSIEEAITILGFNAVHQLLLATSLMSTVGTGHEAVDVNDFWQHSFGVGMIAKHLLPRADRDTQSEALVCGILHDIGWLVLARNDPDAFVSFYYKRKQVTNLEEEAGFFGIDHQKLGEILARKWNFPESILTTIANHHTPQDASEKFRRLVSTVNIADMLCHALRVGDSGNFYVAEFHPDAWQALEMGMDELETALRGALKEIEQAGEMLGILG